MNISHVVGSLLLVISTTTYATQENQNSQQIDKATIKKMIPIVKQVTSEFADKYNIPSWGFGTNFNYECIVSHPNPKFNLEFKNAKGEKKNCKIQVNHTKIGALLNAGVDFNALFFLGVNNACDIEKIKTDGVELGQGLSLNLSAHSTMFALNCQKLDSELKKDAKKIVTQHEKEWPLANLTKEFICSEKSLWMFATKLIDLVKTRENIEKKDMTTYLYMLLLPIKYFAMLGFNPIIGAAIFVSNLKLTWIKLKNSPGSVLIVGYSIEPIQLNLLPSLGSLFSSSNTLDRVLTTLPAPCYIPAGGKIVAL